MMRAELLGAVDKITEGLVPRDSDLAHLRGEVSTKAIRIAARRARAVADELERVADSEDAARWLTEARDA